LAFNDLSIIKRMNEDSIALFLNLSGLSNSIIKSCTSQNDLKPFTSKPLHTFDFQFRSNRRHNNGTLDLKSFATVGNTLSMVSSTGCNNTSLLFLLGKTSKGIGRASDFKTSNSLEILSF
jgi:hypothetical protein